MERRWQRAPFTGEPRTRHRRPAAGRCAGCVAALALAAATAACTTPMFTMPPGPAPYRVGFHDGCDAGYANAGSPFYDYVADPRPATVQEPYASGWRTGFDRCRYNYQRIQTAVSIILGPP